jgi:uracil-DNA glycosylase
MNEIETLHREILACSRCAQAGFIPLAVPVVCEPMRSRMMLIGQAPGQVELTQRRPFAGRAGRVLFRWMSSIGIEEETFRRGVYMTSITKCFPGKAKSGPGDRRPSAREITLCRPWLEQQLALLRPDAVLLVGGMAIDRVLPRSPLTRLIGRRFMVDGVTYIPLPHPSGASRWLNDPENTSLLGLALEHARDEWDRCVAPSMRDEAVGAHSV